MAFDGIHAHSTWKQCHQISIGFGGNVLGEFGIFPATILASAIRAAVPMLQQLDVMSLRGVLGFLDARDLCVSLRTCSALRCGTSSTGQASYSCRLSALP